MNEIPTPETNAFMIEHGRAVAAQKTRPSTWDKLQSLERRLTIEKNRAEDMGELAHANACEAMEYRRLLTIAREALQAVATYPIAREHNDGPCLDRRDMLEVCRALALTITAPNHEP